MSKRWAGLWMLVGGVLMTCSRDEEPPAATDRCNEVADGSSECPLPLGLREPEEIRPSEARDRLWPYSGVRQYVVPRSWRAKALTELVRAVAEAARTGHVPGQLVTRADTAGFSLQRWSINDVRYVALLERREVYGQAGAFVFRVGPRSPLGREIILQAPHSLFDRNTGSVALDVFLAAKAEVRALFINTLHRHMQLDGTKSKAEDNPADSCHNEGHLLAVAIRAALSAFEAPVLIQLHGYGQDRTIAGRPGAEAIVSAGDREASTPVSTAIARKLASSLESEVVRFPEDTTSLGATTNVQGHDVRAQPGASFVHVEMSSPLRRRLAEEPNVLEVFQRAVVDGVREVAKEDR